MCEKGCSEYCQTGWDFCTALQVEEKDNQGEEA